MRRPVAQGWFEARKEGDSGQEPELPEETCPLHPTYHEQVCHGPRGLSAWDTLNGRKMNSPKLANTTRERNARGLVAFAAQTWHQAR